MRRTLRYLTTSLALGCLAGTANAVVIDTFETDQPAISRTAPADTGTRVDHWISGSGILGGERELTLTLHPTIADGTTSSADVSGGAYNYNKDSTAGTFSYAFVVWDGADGTGTVDTSGLGGVDLTEGGRHDAIAISVNASDNPATVYIVADSSFGYSSRAALNLPGGISSPQTFIVPFSAFSVLGFNGPATFNSIGALQLQIYSPPSQNLAIGRVETTSTLSASKRGNLLVDTHGNSVANPGDVLRYTVQVANTMGSGQVNNVVFRDTLDSNTNLVAGSVTTTQGAVLSGNNPGDTVVEIDFGALPGGTTATVNFDAAIDASTPASVTQIVNQGLVSADGLTNLLTDDPDTAAAIDATVVAVLPAPAPPPPPTPGPGTSARAIPVTGPAGLALTVLALLIAGARSRLL
ncbi:DUF11 domain-containing protein [Parahaliea mediterranea]|uniref:DUF11 domain-containing protein n=1 Tax=Parahaliea mediterranea TaxID=651086 RepID=A0A939DBF8_9GAMM|nr:DUF11 domain-containing protein [Parahaliea mediterranea]MBN7795080.1 DUF11 domain-containing protein [Parahaliea mediterranea]